MRYRMIAIDLDGTLLDPRGNVSPDNLNAIENATRAGVLVVPCTGRAWCESRPILAHLAELEVGVFVGGASVNEMSGGASHDLAMIDPILTGELVEFLFDLPEAVLVFRDGTLAGHDYLVTGRGKLSANTRWWFEASGSKVHFVDRPAEEHLSHALRVGIVAPEDRMRQVADRVAMTFGARVVMQWFKAVQGPRPRETMCVLEVFAAGVDKWRGLSWIAEQRGITREQVAAIGDEVNDLAMIRGSGCGIAMGNAIEPVKAAARHHTLDNRHSGVAHAIARLLSGEWR